MWPSGSNAAQMRGLQPMRMGGRERDETPRLGRVRRALNHLMNARAFRLAAVRGDLGDIALAERVARKHALAARDLLEEARPLAAERPSPASTEHRSWAPRANARDL